MNIGGDCLPETSYKTQGLSARNFTLTEQLESKKADLEAKLDEVNRALSALKKNPELQSLFDLISRVRY